MQQVSLYDAVNKVGYVTDNEGPINTTIHGRIQVVNVLLRTKLVVTT